MGHSTNANAQNKGCKEGWKYEKERACSSNSDGIKTFLYSAP